MCSLFLHEAISCISIGSCCLEQRRKCLMHQFQRRIHLLLHHLKTWNNNRFISKYTLQRRMRVFHFTQIHCPYMQWRFSFKIHFSFSFYKFFCQWFLFLYYYFISSKFLYQPFLFYSISILPEPLITVLSSFTKLYSPYKW